MKVIGIDPGKKGYMVFTDCEKNVFDYSKLLFDDDNSINLAEFKKFLSKIDPHIIVIEKVMGRGGWGAKQNFALGYILGQIFTLSRSFPYTLVRPVDWQRTVCQNVKKDNTAKARSFKTYERLFPTDPLKILNQKKYDDNILDAFLISIYGQMLYDKVTNFNFTWRKADD